MLFATDGLVTRCYESGNSDKVINIITPEGRIAVIVKGAKSPTSKTAAISQTFTYGNFEIYEKNSTYWLRGGSVINPFYDISGDITRVALASYLCELANELTDENEECRELLRLLLNSLYLIGRGKKELSLIKAVFELRCMYLSGYAPEVSGCAYCREPLRENMYLDVSGGKLVCSECLLSRADKKINISKEFDYSEHRSTLCQLTPSVTAALRYALYSPDERAFAFEIKDADELEKFGAAAEAYVLEHIERGFPTLDFYKSVK